MGRKRSDKEKSNTQPKEKEKNMEEFKKEVEQNLIGEPEHPAQIQELGEAPQEPEATKEPEETGETDNGGESEETTSEAPQEPEATKEPEETDENDANDDRDEAENEIESYLSETDPMKKQQILSVIKRMNYKLHDNVTTTFRGSPLPNGAHKNEYKVLDITPLKVSLKRGPYQISVKPEDIYPV